MITVTERAAHRVKTVASREGREPVLRVGVKGGGCSGFTYFYDFDELRDTGTVIEVDGARFVVDPKSVKILDATEFDYETNLLRGGFKFRNPNAARTCSCGESFGI